MAREWKNTVVGNSWTRAVYHIRPRPRPLSAAAPRCREFFTTCASPPGCCSPPPLARWMHVARRRIGLCACIPLTIARRRLLPVQVATVKGRDYKFTIPDAPRCPTEGRLHLWIGGRKSEPAAAGAGQGLPPRKTQDSQDVQRPCTTHLRWYWGVLRLGQRLLRGIHRARSMLGALP